MQKKRFKAISIMVILILTPLLAWAHGDDEVSINSFFGPLLALITIFMLVSIGKFVIQRIKKGFRPGVRL